MTGILKINQLTQFECTYLYTVDILFLINVVVYSITSAVNLRRYSFIHTQLLIIIGANLQSVIFE